jgi:sialic acid synthase SpsE
MLTIKHAFGVQVGYSDHTLGIEVPIAAVAMGACVIEKHFTLDRNLPGPDHMASLEPQELQQMISSIRNVEKALGSGIKLPTISELKNRAIVRKSIVARRAISAGELFSEENLTTKRPGVGVSPMRWDDVIGRVACRSFVIDEFIEL